MIKPSKCVYCKKMPTVLDMGDLVYVQCPCGRWNPYEFCGVRPDSAVEQWNYANTRVPLYRGTSRRVKP